ncbi:MAG TPA: cytochrome c [Thermoanaerobaculia bacterium]|nr:cytochrome c [Thermoanaerobaculia bacterium]
MKTVLTIVAVLLLLAVALLGFIFSGVYDVAASTPDNGLIAWALETTQHRSVHRAAEAFEETAKIPDLEDPKRIQNGFVHYYEMCATCHGAPGVPISEIGQGLNPYPPELTAHADEPAENFWIVKNGIKMTGMPAFGVTHSDDEIWDIVAFLNRMPKLSSQQYQQMIVDAGLMELPPPVTGHTHAPGTPPHQD